jgi:tetratricopeptide (TPR) repeat protein
MDGMTDGREEIGRARSAAERAVQFDPNLAEAHAVLAFCLLVDGKLEESERSFQRALALNPSSTVTLSWHALVLRLMGRVDLAIAEYQRVAIMDPLWFINLLLLGSNLSDVGQWDEALSVLDRAMALRNDPYMPAVGARARALFVLGRKSDAVEMARLVRRRFDVFPRWQADAQAVFVLRQAGLEKEAAEHAAEVFARAPADSYMRGFVHVALGQFERALPYLERTSSTTGRSFVYLDQM